MVLASSMEFIDETAVPVALPAIQEAIGATAVDAQWVVAAESSRSGSGDPLVVGARKVAS